MNTESASSSLPTQRGNLREKLFCLKSSDGKVFKIDEAVARQMNFVWNFREEFLIEKFRGETLEIVIEYCKKHFDGTFSSDEELQKWDDNFMKSDYCLELYKVPEAANYLSINSLVDLCCQTIADLITACKTPSEIRAKFNIISDFTPAEQDYVCRKNQWAFESKDVAFIVSPFARPFIRRARIRGGKDPDSSPDHLIEDVFTRMPAKSIARCCCVSKAWASIISRPSFTTLFSSRVSPRLLFACSQEVTNDDYSVDGKLFFLSSHLPRTLEGFSSTLRVNYQTDLSLVRGEEETNVSVNGLVLGVQEKPFTDNNYTMCECVIHNSSTGKSITLPTLDPARRRKFENTQRVLGTQCYFGYDPVGKKYKVLSMTTTAPVGHGNTVSRLHQCLTLRGGDDLLWRSIHCGIEHFPIDHNPICISGHIFNPAAQMINAEISMVVDFDVNSEKFTSIKYFDKTQVFRQNTFDDTMGEHIQGYGNSVQLQWEVGFSCDSRPYEEF